MIGKVLLVLRKDYLEINNEVKCHSGAQFELMYLYVLNQ